MNTSLQPGLKEPDPAPPEKRLNANKILIVPHFYSRRISALSRYASEVVLSDHGGDYSILTNNQPDPCCPYPEEVTNRTIVNQCGLVAFLRHIDKFVGEHFNRKPHLVFFGGYLGAFLFLLFLKNNKFPVSLYLYTDKFKFSSLRYVKTSDFVLNCRRIFCHNYFLSLFVPRLLFRFVFNKKSVRHLFFPSRRLFYEYRFLACRKNVVYPGSFIDGSNVSLARKARKSLKIGTDDFLVLHSGLASPLRGYDNLIQAVNLLNDDKVKLLLLLYAESSESVSAGELSRVAKLTENNDNILLVTDPEYDLDDYFTCADLAVFPYRYIGDIPECPLTVLETSKAGTPTLTTDIGALPEYLKNENSFLSSDKPAEIAQTIVDFKNDGDKLNELAEENKAAVGTWDQFCDVLDKRLDECL